MRSVVSGQRCPDTTGFAGFENSAGIARVAGSLLHVIEDIRNWCAANDYIKAYLLWIKVISPTPVLALMQRVMLDLPYASLT